MSDTRLNLGNDCTIYKLNELILNNCVPFDCGFDDLKGQAENTVHMLNWTVRSVKFLGVEFDQSEDEEVSVADTTHL